MIKIIRKTDDGHAMPDFVRCEQRTCEMLYFNIQDMITENRKRSVNLRGKKIFEK